MVFCNSLVYILLSGSLYMSLIPEKRWIQENDLTLTEFIQLLSWEEHINKLELTGNGKT